MLRVRRGDKVCILLGGNTPFMLRPCGSPRGRGSDKEYYKVVGEVSVDELW